ncbi:MAG: hypothetical protein ABIE42_11940 [Candidatus Eisenbacteria bacterium]
MRVLAVDVDHDLLGDFEAMRPGGCELVSANGANGVLAALKSGVWDAVLLDVGNPGPPARAVLSEGFAILGMVTGALFGRVPVIALAESEDAETSMWCGRLGATRVLDRVTGPSKIFEIIAAVVSGASDASRTKSGQIW